MGERKRKKGLREEKTAFFESNALRIILQGISQKKDFPVVLKEADDYLVACKNKKENAQFKSCIIMAGRNIAKRINNELKRRGKFNGRGPEDPNIGIDIGEGDFTTIHRATETEEKGLLRSVPIQVEPERQQGPVEVQVRVSTEPKVNSSCVELDESGR